MSSSLALSAALLSAVAPSQLRPPAVPLVACDPYFSIWSRADRLTDVPTVHWTGRAQPLQSLIRIDGQSYRLMGTEPASVPALKQTAVEVMPTRTICRFEDQGVAVEMVFMTPALPDDIELLSRPVTYITWTVRSTDGQAHNVNLYFDASALPAVDQNDQPVSWGTGIAGGLSFSRFGTTTQKILGKTGDDRRIDWGYFYAAAPRNQVQTTIADKAASAFAATGSLPAASTAKSATASSAPEAAFTFNLGSVGGKAVSRYVVLAYDDVYGMQYFGQNLRPYWRKDGADAAALLTTSHTQYASLKKRCEAFDKEIMADLRKSGGEKYALMTALSYRQCTAGNKIVADAKGQPLLFPKENTSNGCVGTVDVIFPMAPQFLLFGPSLTKAMLVSNLDYASSPRWKWPFAPHDLGTYPKANGQVYGGGERTEDNQMPVEESGNMLILVAALAQMEGSAKFAEKYWPALERWAKYLEEKGFDPENQLSTDDFMGHLAHNTNLSVKAALGLASFGKLCEWRGLKSEAARYKKISQDHARRWVREANDGDHYLLAFDKPGSWSQKYNLVWDKILGLDLFTQAERQKEMDFYLKVQNPFGTALDSRQNGTPAKIDWTLWSATLTGNQSEFDRMVDPLFKYLNETPQRVGMGDLYNTQTGHHIGMHSRPVVGAFFLKLLYDKAVWKKWGGRDATRASDWAALPKPPVYEMIVPTSEKEAQTWSYTTDRPSGEWFATGFDASSWKSGPGAFGTAGTPGIDPQTRWDTADIWIRREFTVGALPSGQLYLSLYHDEDVEVYLNGTLIAHQTGWTTSYEKIAIDKKVLKKGSNTIAIHCHQTGGGQGVDAGFVRRKG